MKKIAWLLRAHTNLGYIEVEAKTLAQILKTISKHKQAVAYVYLCSIQC